MRSTSQLVKMYRKQHWSGNQTWCCDGSKSRRTWPHRAL